MENLNKQQIILLTLLVTFVTSIATGIVTVSLLDQAPKSVTQTINRVVEKTIERVVPSVDTGSGKTETVTVVVRDEDLTISAVEKNAKSLVRIKGKTPGVSTEGLFGIGLVVSKDGLIVADKTILVLNTSYMGYMPDGQAFDLGVPVYTDQSSIILFKPAWVPDGYVFTPAVFANSENLKLGQTVISISGQDQNFVSIGNISSIYQGNSVDVSGKTTKSILSLETSFNKDNVINGSPIINLTGEIAGMRLGNDPVTRNIFTSSNFIKDQVASLTKK